MPEILIQRWEESEHEPGWGTTVRPDGYSIHLTMQGCRQFREQFWAEQRAALGDDTPSIYRREAGEPEPVSVSLQKLSSLRRAIGKKTGIWGEGESYSGELKPRSTL